MVVVRGWEDGEGGVIVQYNGYEASAWKDEKVLEMDGGDGCRTL